MAQKKLESDLMRGFAKERDLFQDLKKVISAESLKWLMSNVEARSEASEGQRRVVPEGGPAPYFDQVLA